MEQDLIGKKVIVRANVAGVHAGEVVAVDFSKQTIVLKNTRRLWRVYTRDSSGSISDVCANGLKEGENHSIGAVIPSTVIVNPPGLEISEMTDHAWDSVTTYE